MKHYLLVIFLSCYQIVCAQEESPEFYAALVRQDSIAQSKHLHPLPLGLSKIQLSERNCNDSLVVALYGKGFYDENSGHHGGGRYFTDPGKKVILITEIGVDYFIEAVILTLVDSTFDDIDVNIDSIPIAEKLSTNTFLIKGIQLGDSPKKIMKAFGEPNKNFFEKDFRQLVYTDDIELWDEVLYYHANFGFLNEKLVRISIYNGD